MSPLRNERASSTGPTRVDLILLVLGTAAVALRVPTLLTEPRVWAEEGSVYLSAALARGADMLAEPFLGYYSLVPNLAAWSATQVQPEAMAAVTTAFAFVAQVVPLAFVCLTTHPAWDRSWKKGLLLLALVLITDGTLHLSTTNSQYQLALTAALVLTFPPHGDGRVRIGFVALLLLSCLASPQAPFLLPAFLYKAWRSRSRETTAQALTIGVGLVLQGVATVVAAARPFVRPIGFDPETPARWTLASSPLVMLKDYALMFWVNPFVPTDTRYPVSFRASHPVFFDLLVAASLVLLLIVLAAAWRRGGWRRLSVLGFALLGALSMATSFGMMGALRYGHPGWGLLALLLVDAAGSTAVGRRAWTVRSAAATLLAAMLLLGVSRYRGDMRLFFDPDWPGWAEELARARREGSPVLRGWPYRDNWLIDRGLIDGPDLSPTNG